MGSGRRGDSGETGGLGNSWILLVGFLAAASVFLLVYGKAPAFSGGDGKTAGRVSDSRDAGSSGRGPDGRLRREGEPVERMELQRSGRPGEGIRVLVRDRSGRAAGDVPVGLYSEANRSWLLRRTGPGGERAFFAAKDWQKKFRKRGGRVWVTFAFPMKDPPLAEVSLDRVPERPVELVLPPTGKVLVAVQGEGGESRGLPESFRAWIRRGWSLELGKPLERKWADLGWGAARKIRKGRALFPWVGLGVDLEVKAVAEGGFRRLYYFRPRKTAQVPPLTRPGETAVVRFSFTFSGLLVTGRILGKDGTPWAGRKMAASLGGAGGEYPWKASWFGFSTGEGGAFGLGIPPGRFLKSAGFLWMRTGDRSGWARVFLEVRPGGKRVDVGPVRLRDSPVLLSGKVLDEGGRPVPAVRVDGSLLEVGPRGGRARRFGPTILGTTDSLGSFVLYGWFRPGMEVEAALYSREWMGKERKRFPAGSQGVILRAIRRLRIEGRVLLDPPVSRKGVMIYACRKGYISGRRIERDGKFRISGLPEGVYDVRIFFRGRPGKEDFCVPRVRPWRKEEEADVRLKVIDLRGRIRLFRLEPVLPDGRPAMGFLLGVGGSSDTPFFVRRPAGEPLTLLGWGDSLPVLVCAPGTKVWKGKIREGDNRIDLESGIPVKLVLPGGFPLLPSWVRLGCSLEFLGEKNWVNDLFLEQGLLPPGRGGPIFGPGGSLTLGLPFPGVYRVGWLLWYPEREAWACQGMAGEAARIRVGKGGEPQVFRVGPDPARVLDELEALEKR